jgi:hypothetical protein
MSGKLARIESLMAAGFDVEDIDSDHGHIEVTLARGRERHIVLLDEQDAWDVLYGGASRPVETGRRVVAPSP